MSGVLFEGTLYVDQIVAGVAQGLEQWPGIAKFAVKPNSELVEQTSKDKGKYGTITASVAIPKPADFSVTITDVSGSQLAMALQGSAAALSQSSGTTTAAVFTAKLGKYLELGKINIAASGFSVTNSAATTTYVLNTDYTVNYAAGLVYIVPGGAITEGQSIKITYNYNAVSGTKVFAATQAQVRGRMILDGNNLVDGRPGIMTVWDALLTADGEVDFMSDKPIELSMKGRMQVPTGKTAPFEIEYGLTFS